TLSPNVSSVAGAPLAVRVHIIVTMLFWAYFPFTKLVHLFSAPVGYLVRPYISIRAYGGGAAREPSAGGTSND
ncbi:MAG: respiratory nitrate reductase subunit gamma, partial [Halodesulfurarchaeum sp.]